MAKFIRDAAHGRLIPTGSEFRFVRPLMIQMAETLARQASRGERLNLKPWIEAMKEAAVPVIWHYYQHGAREKAKELLALLGKRRRSLGWQPIVRKNISTAVRGIDFSFDLLLPQVRDAVQNAAFALAKTTMETAALEAKRAIQSARAQLDVGLRSGEGIRELNRRFYEIFSDPHKAARIAQSEASRAMHAGQLQAARESEVVRGLEWLASADACDACLKLNGKQVKLGEPFYVDPKGGPYSVVLHPTLHPLCMCSTKDVIDFRSYTPETEAKLLAIAAGPRSGSTGSGGIMVGGG
jgi:hypothetical protein